MGFGYIFAGFVFLFNPNVNIIDIMPDFIGCSMIIFGLYRLRDLAPAFEDSRRGFIRLLACSALKTGALFITASLPDKGYLLIFTFCFSLAEVYIMLSAFSYFYEGAFFVGTLYNGDATVKYLNKAKTATSVFIVLHELFTLMPEFVYLNVNEDLGYVLASYKGTLTAICFTFSLAAGIVWLLYMRRMYKIIAADRPFSDRMETYYNEYIKPDKNRFIRRRLGFALTAAFIGFIFLADFYVDGVDWLPDAIGYALIITALLVSGTGNYIKKYKGAAAFCSFALLLSGGSWLYNKLFLSNYYGFGLSHSIETYRRFIVSASLSAAVSAAAIIVIIIMARYFLCLIKEHTGRPVESVFVSIIQKENERVSQMKIKCVFFLITGVMSAVSGALYAVFIYFWPVYWLINAAVDILWIICSVKLIFDLREQIENKYL